MGDILDFNAYKDKVREQLENQAANQYNATKINDDLYLIPEVHFVSGSTEVEELLEELNTTPVAVLEQEVVDEINNIIDDKEDQIGIMVYELDETSDKIVFEIFTKKDKFLLETKMPFNREMTRILTGLVAGSIEKTNIQAIHFLKLNYEELKELLQ